MAGAAGKENAAKRSRTAEGQQGLPERCDRDRHRNTIKYQARVSYKPDGSNATLEPSTTQRRRRALQIAAYEAKLAGGMDDGPLGWSGDSLSAQARPGVALHYHAPSLPHPCVPQAGLHTFAGTANEDWAAEEGEHER